MIDLPDTANDAECILIYVYHNNVTNEMMLICINNNNNIMLSCRVVRVYVRVTLDNNIMSTRFNLPRVANYSPRLPRVISFSV